MGQEICPQMGDCRKNEQEDKHGEVDQTQGRTELLGYDNDRGHGNITNHWSSTGGEDVLTSCVHMTTVLHVKAQHSWLAYPMQRNLAAL